MAVAPDEGEALHRRLHRPCRVRLGQRAGGEGGEHLFLASFGLDQVLRDLFRRAPFGLKPARGEIVALPLPADRPAHQHEERRFGAVLRGHGRQHPSRLREAEKADAPARLRQGLRDRRPRGARFLAAVLHRLVQPVAAAGADARLVPGVDGDAAVEQRVDERKIAAVRPAVLRPIAMHQQGHRLRALSRAVRQDQGSGQRCAACRERQLSLAASVQIEVGKARKQGEACGDQNQEDKHREGEAPAVRSCRLVHPVPFVPPSVSGRWGRDVFCSTCGFARGCRQARLRPSRPARSWMNWKATRPERLPRVVDHSSASARKAAGS